jgi:parallel beta-helix repeat protein
MRQKLLIVTLVISTIFIISSCQKETRDDNNNSLENIPSKTFNVKAFTGNSIKYPEIGKMIKEIIPGIRQTIEKLKLERSSNSGAMEKSKPGKAIIRIPADYPTLQQAVDNSVQNTKIIVTGIVTDFGDVLVNVPNLVIQGENKTSAINGSRLIISAPGVKVINLNINMGVVISGAGDETLADNKIKSTVNVAWGNFNGIPLDMAVLIDQSSNCIFKNNEVKGVDGYIGIHLGILMIGGSGHTLESNKISFDLILNPQNYFECIHGDGSNNNTIKNCNIKSNISLNSEINSFGVNLVGTGNEVNNCKAENVSGPFALFGDNNKINNCEARIFKWSGFEVNGNNNKIKNCKADGNLTGNYNASNFGLRGFASFSGGNNIFDNCEAKNNEVGLELAAGNVSISGDLVSKCNLYSNNAYGAFLYKSTLCTLEKNTIKLNRIVGINLVEVSNSGVSNNTSVKNTTSDFNQTNCNSNTLTGNKFGTTTSELPWVGPF